MNYPKGSTLSLPDLFVFVSILQPSRAGKRLTRKIRFIKKNMIESGIPSNNSGKNGQPVLLFAHVHTYFILDQKKLVGYSFLPGPTQNCSTRK